MEERGHRITRYADDFVICCRSRKGAERVLKSVMALLERKMGLRVHPVKTRIVNNWEESFTFLGYEFKPTKWMTPSDKTLKKFKERVKEITRRNQTVNVQELVKRRLNPYLRGWGNYFTAGDGITRFKELDAWIRRRIRMVQMRSWRKPRITAERDAPPRMEGRVNLNLHDKMAKFQFQARPLCDAETMV